MIPRDYQRAAVDAAHDRTAEQGNTMLVLPTGAGKTAIAGFFVGEEAERQRDAKVLVLQHTDELIEQNPSIARSTIAVVGSEYWPLPWYLKAFETIGYWPEIETMHRDFPLVFTMPGQAQRTEAQLQDSHTALPRSLRADVPVVLYLRNDIWQQWTKEPAL